MEEHPNNNEEEKLIRPHETNETNHENVNDDCSKTVRIFDIVGQDIIGRRFDATWRIGGKNFDKRFLVFASQIFVSISVIGFCMYQLHVNDECENQQEYISLLTLIVGIFLPEPSFRRDDATF